MKLKTRFIPAAILLLLILSGQLFGADVSVGEYRLEIKENSGRFILFATDSKGEAIPLFSDEDPRTTSFFVFEDNAFHKLGDTFRFRSTFIDKKNGGIFSWQSKTLSVIQNLELNDSGELSVAVSISNITETPVRAGLKILIDTNYEKERRFVLGSNGDRLVLESEGEAEEMELFEFWASGILGDGEKSLMYVPGETLPSRIVFGNWDRLDDADYYYRTVEDRSFNNPPYSINDSAVLILYPQSDILPGNTVGFEMTFKAADTVADPRDILFGDREPLTTESDGDNSAVGSESFPVDDSLPSTENTEEKAESPSDSDEPPEISAPQTGADPIKEVSEPPVSALSSPKTELNITESLDTLEEISDIIELLAIPGMIGDFNLSRLEKLISDLEELKRDENTQ